MIVGDRMPVEIEQRPSRLQAVAELNRQVVELRRRLEAELDGTDDDDVLSALLVAEDTVKQVRALRALLLRHVRHRGVSWSAIAGATHVPATTWRTRHRATGED